MKYFHTGNDGFFLDDFTLGSFYGVRSTEKGKKRKEIKKLTIVITEPCRWKKSEIFWGWDKQVNPFLSSQLFIKTHPFLNSWKMHGYYIIPSQAINTLEGQRKKQTHMREKMNVVMSSRSTMKKCVFRLSWIFDFSMQAKYFCVMERMASDATDLSVSCLMLR